MQPAGCLDNEAVHGAFGGHEPQRVGHNALQVGYIVRGVSPGARLPRVRLNLPQPAGLRVANQR